MFSVDLSTREFAGHGVVTLRGKLEVVDAPAVASHLVTATAVYGPRVILDVSGLECIDSAGLGVLVRALTRTRRSGGDLPLAGPRDVVSRVLTATGLSGVFSVFSSVEQAIRAAEEARRLHPAAW